MKTDDEKFDAFLKSKMAEEPIAFDEQYWQQASAMLDEARPKRKRFGMWWVTGLVLSGLVAIAVYQTLEQPITTKKQVVHLPQQQPEPTSTPVYSSAHQTAAAKSSSRQLSSMHNTNKPAASTPVQPIEFTPKPTAPITTPTVIASALPTTRNSQTKHEVSQNQPVITASAHTSESASTIQNNNVQSHTDQPNVVAQNLADTIAITKLPPQEIALERVNLSAAWAMPLFEQLPQLTLENRPELAFENKQRPQPINLKANFFIEGGVNWFNTSALSTTSLDGHLGLLYAFPLKNRFSMGVGLGYTQLHQTTGTRYYATTSYGFGEQKKITGIKTVRLDYLELPLLLNYAITPKQGLFAGGALLYVVNSSDYKKNPENVTFNEKTNRYYQAYNPFDVQLLMGYHYWLSPSLKVSASYHYGVTDITNNMAFKQQAYHNNKGLRFTIGYQLY